MTWVAPFAAVDTLSKLYHRSHHLVRAPHIASTRAVAYRNPLRDATVIAMGIQVSGRAKAPLLYLK